MENKLCKDCGKLLPVSRFYTIISRGKLYTRKTCITCLNARSSNWKKQNRKIINEQRKEWRHKTGRCKRVNNGNGVSKTKGYKKMAAKQYKYNKKMAGKLTIKTIQLIYEDNIKKYGTLTCYLCKKPIDMQLKFFSKITSEHLEHKTPLSRGGTNDYENLGVACSRCNIRKHNKTVAEYKEYLNKTRS